MSQIKFFYKIFNFIFPKMGNCFWPEHEKTLVRIFLKIDIWVNANKNKVYDSRVRTILESLLTFRFDSFVNPEFIFFICLTKIAL